MMRYVGGLVLVMYLVGCSAIGLSEQNTQATAQFETAVAGTVESRIDLQATESAPIPTDAESTAEITAEADSTVESTQEPETIPEATDELDSESTAETTSEAESTVEVTPDANTDVIVSSAEASVFGSVPVDSDRLDSITAMTFDATGRLLVSLRAGDIYALDDTDDDGIADTSDLIFQDLADEIGQVSGIFSENEVIYIINGSRLSQLRDTDDDGVYDSVTEISESLPANQALLQASNSIVRSPDGRYFTADPSTGEILQLTLIE